MLYFINSLIVGVKPRACVVCFVRVILFLSLCVSICLYYVCMFGILLFVAGGCEAVVAECWCSVFSRCCHLLLMGCYIAVWMVCLCWYLCLFCLLVL